MIFVDDSTIKIDGVILPGIIKSLEIKADARVEEQEIEGKSAKPKQATGYEDAKINIEIALEDGEAVTKEEKLKDIQTLFRKPGQEKPRVYEIINEHTAIRGIKKVIFKALTTKESNKKSELAVSIEFWEFITTTITATSSSKSSNNKKNSSSSGADNLNSDYSDYLSSSRGKAPKINSKTESSPAKDTASSNVSKNKLSQMPY